MLGYIISYKNEINVEEYEIQSFDILHKTYLNNFVIENNKVLYVNDIINSACKYGHIQVLEWFKNSGYEFEYNEWAINYASINGHVQVLEWFKNSGYEFKYNEWAINYASQYGYIQVLEWFKNSGYEFKYEIQAIYCASIYGHIQVLEWFKHSGFKFKYSKFIFETMYIKILIFYSNNLNIKKLIKWTPGNNINITKLNKWTNSIIFIKTIKFKTINKYIKGYQKN